MPADQSVWVDDQQCTTPVEPRSQLGEHKPVGRSRGHGFLLPFPEESQLFAQKQILSCHGHAATRYRGEKLKPSLRIVRRFRTILARRVKTLNIVQSSHGNSLISD